MASPINRTRVLRKAQSKGGCYTCRDRKVKCDEVKPTCQECQRLRIRCDGYPQSAYDSESPHAHDYDMEVHQSDSKDADRNQPTEGKLGLLPGHNSANNDSEAQIFVQAGLGLLLNSYGDEHTIGQSALRILIKRYVASSSAVNAACAALGAATESQQNMGSHSMHLDFPKYYGRAIELHKREFYNLERDMNAFLATCILLSATETILQRQQAAMEFLHAACRLYQSSISDARSQVVSNSQQPATLSNGDDTDKDLLLRIFDINALAFTYGTRPPSIEHTSLDQLGELLRHLSPASANLDRIVVHTIHAAFVLINQAIYSSHETQSFTSISIQNKCTEILRQCISILSTKIGNEPPGERLIHWLVTRNLCISAKLQLSNMYEVQETAWDRHGPMFQVLIGSAEEILQHRFHWKSENSPQQKAGFTTQLGVLEPLRLAAVKYRNGKWRRKAIKCLQQAEREGPWIGEVLGLISERIMDLEELCINGRKPKPFGVVKTDDSPSRDELDTDDVPEHARVSFLSIKEGNGTTNAVSWPLAGSAVMTLDIFKRRQPKMMFPVLLQHGKAELSTAQLSRGDLDPAVWEMWREQIEFRPGQCYRILASTRTKSEAAGGIH